LLGIAHPNGTPWALAGGLGKALVNRAPEALPTGLQNLEGTALDGALSMARALP
jgi:hypothetical protein